MPHVSLTAELDRFAEQCVRSGRYADVSDVHRAALRLLQDAEARRAAFVASLDAAVAEAEREGFFSGKTVLAEMAEDIEAAVRADQ